MITSVQRRRRWTVEEKRVIVEEAGRPGSSVSVVARKYGGNANQIFHWRKLIREGALCAVRSDQKVVPTSEVKQLKPRIRELERFPGKKTMEVEILKEALELSRGNNCSCGWPCPEDRILPMKVIAETFAGIERVIGNY